MTRAMTYAITAPTGMPGRSEVTGWGLRCEHGVTTTDDVERAFTPGQILNRLVAARMELPAETSNAVCSIVAARSLLGILHTTRWGCDCGVLPQPLGALLREADGGPVQ
jgi:hypothetical protein